MISNLIIFYCPNPLRLYLFGLIALNLIDFFVSTEKVSKIYLSPPVKSSRPWIPMAL